MVKYQSLIPLISSHKRYKAFKVLKNFAKRGGGVAKFLMTSTEGFRNEGINWITMAGRVHKRIPAGAICGFIMT